MMVVFLLTHPVWDVTRSPHKFLTASAYFYSHIPCGMWRSGYMILCLILHFYSHIPCGMWPSSSSAMFPICSFLLTHPVWDVTAVDRSQSPYYSPFLLTHPVWDVTVIFSPFPSQHIYFYSHIPCGMWHQHKTTCRRSRYFYSHIPCGMWLSGIL